MPCSLTPVGLLAPGHCGEGVLSPLDVTRTTPTTKCLSRLIHTAFGFAVYASQAPLRDIGPRKTRFRLVASLCRAGLSPAGSHLRGFRSVDACVYIASPSPRLSLAHNAWHFFSGADRLGRWLELPRQDSGVRPDLQVPPSGDETLLDMGALLSTSTAPSSLRMTSPQNRVNSIQMKSPFVDFTTPALNMDWSTSCANIESRGPPVAS